jgi:predicted PurR-regulated permease PerM
MTLTDKNKAYLIGGLSLAVLVSLILLVGEIVLPFVFAIFIAYLINPLILKIQKKIKNRAVALTSFFIVVTLLFFGGIFFFGGHVIKDTKRLVNAVEVFIGDNEDQINYIKESLGGFVDDVYYDERVQEQINSSDTLTAEEQQESIISTLGSVYSFLESPEEQNNDPEKKPWSALNMLLYTLIYTAFILYTYDYFEEKYAKYFKGKKTSNKSVEGIWRDFKMVFMSYFKQRAWVVLINMGILITTFSIMDLPGAIIIGVLTAILSYASHFHYLSLPIGAIGCWVLSVENESSFLLYFGILLMAFILVSVLEETIYFDKIMKSVNGMNPAIMMLSFALWIYVFGGLVGTIIALPLTELILIYLGKMILFSAEKRKDLLKSEEEQT